MWLIEEMLDEFLNVCHRNPAYLLSLLVLLKETRHISCLFSVLRMGPMSKDEVGPRDESPLNRDLMNLFGVFLFLYTSTDFPDSKLTFRCLIGISSFLLLKGRNPM